MEWINKALNAKEQRSLFRELLPIEKIGKGRVRILAPDNPGNILIDFSSNDYLAFSEHPALLDSSKNLLHQFGTGTCASRLMSGDLSFHHHLESKVASLVGQEGALLFGSGYLANVGVITALVGKGDIIFCDRNNHASIYDGCLLSGARLIRFRHNDANDLEKKMRKERARFRHALIIVESIYSMDGDRCPLIDIIELKHRFDSFLMVDEAHALGLYGHNGGGLIEEEGVNSKVDAVVGTFGKALGSYGAFVAAPIITIKFILNRARPFIYSTALPPAVIGASLGALSLLAEHPYYRKELMENIALFKSTLTSQGIKQQLGSSQIVPIIIGESQRALNIASSLQGHGLFVKAVRPPTVQPGTSRLRLSITRHHSSSMLVRAAKVLAETIAHE